MYRIKHVPTGLYYQPHKHRGSHLSKTGKIYQTKANGVFTGRECKVFTVFCQKGSRINKLTSGVLNWSELSYSRYELKAETLLSDWVIENI